ncbi:MAG TPA: hypothetical protein VMT52_17735 [Planctomycetota bacterium]|nr:hypothetical protein [Planctomycetota bacterium]
MSHNPTHDHHPGHGSPAATVEALETDDAHGAPGTGSERYELEDLFRGEAPENTHFLKILGLVVLTVLLAVALAYPFKFLGS